MGTYDLTIGPLIVGSFINTYLFGLVTYQVIVYRNTVFNDPLWLKSLVAALFFIDTSHTLVAIYAAWEIWQVIVFIFIPSQTRPRADSMTFQSSSVANFDNPAILALVSWTVPFTAIAIALVAFLSQLFLAHRVYALTKNKFLVGTICLMSFAGFFFACYAGVYSALIHFISRYGLLDPYVITWLGFQTSTDVLITVSLIYYLSQSRTGFRRTDTVVNRIIRGAVQTGLFASLFALADLFAFLLAHDTNLYTLFAFPMGRIYTNTLLDTLNARSSLKESLAASYTDDSNGFQFTSIPPLAVRRIRVQEEVITTRDAKDSDSEGPQTKAGGYREDRKYAPSMDARV